MHKKIRCHNKQVNVYHLPGNLILLDIKHGVFNRFVHKRIHAGDEEINCAKQRLSIFGQKLLGVSIVTKLILEAKFEFYICNQAYHAYKNRVDVSVYGDSRGVLVI